MLRKPQKAVDQTLRRHGREKVKPTTKLSPRPTLGARGVWRLRRTICDARTISGNWPDTTGRKRQSGNARSSDGRASPSTSCRHSLHNVTNDQRQNKLGIKVHPVDDGADIDTAEVLQGIIRHIEYASGADATYDTAAFHAAACGFGFSAFERITSARTLSIRRRFRAVPKPILRPHRPGFKRA